MADASFASLEDYVSRYGEVDDEKRVTTLLADASNMLLSTYERRFGTTYVEGAHSAFDRSAKAVCCAIVSRALNIPTGMEGITNTSQTAGSYSASVTFANPAGDLYMTKGDLKTLGLTGQRIRSIDAMTWADRSQDATD